MIESYFFVPSRQPRIMDQITPHSLWIGSAGDLQDVRPLYEAGIQAIVQVAYEELLPPLPRGFVVCRFPILDGEGNDPHILHLALQTLTGMLETKFATLVCCQAGTSRSPALAAAALACSTGEPLSVWLTRIATCWAVGIHPGLRREIESFCLK